MHTRLYFICLLAALVVTVLEGQICNGNLGDNIFEAGDFGSGTDNVLQENPRIAPGYSYTTAPAPPDGWYTITNNTAQWSLLYSTWMELRDNSSDPNGYMMVVNADFLPGIFYEQEVNNLCANTLYEFSADIINVVKRNVSNHIAPNVSFLLDDVEQYTTGSIPQDERWKTYGFTFTTGPNQTSIKLTLRNNAPGGIGNDLAIDNISFRACGAEAQILPFEIENICEDGEPINLSATVIGDQYDTTAFQWQRSLDEGITWEDIVGATDATVPHTNLESGFYYYRYLLSNSPANLNNPKCRVNSNVKIVRVVPKFYDIVDTLCTGLTYQVGNSVYQETGIYIDSLTSSIGCDSIVTTQITFVEDPNINADIATTDPSCFGYTDGQIGIVDILNGYPPFQTQLIQPDRTISQALIFSNLTANDYLLKITDRFQCAFSDSVQLFNPEIFVIDIGADLTINLGEPIAFDISSNYPITDFNELAGTEAICYLGCDKAPWVPITSQIYQVEALSEAGCVASDSIAIEVNKDQTIYIPNAFSPNFDGNNDYFSLFSTGLSIMQIKRLAIFDRWGNLIFEQTNFPADTPNMGWDGNINNELAEAGVYAYYFEVQFIDGQTQQFTGDVLLLTDAKQ